MIPLSLSSYRSLFRSVLLFPPFRGMFRDDVVMLFIGSSTLYPFMCPIRSISIPLSSSPHLSSFCRVSPATIFHLFIAQNHPLNLFWYVNMHDGLSNWHLETSTHARTPDPPLHRLRYIYTGERRLRSQEKTNRIT